MQWGYGILIRKVIEMPPRCFTPSKDAVVRSAFIPFKEFSSRHMVSGDVRMLEFFKFLSSKGTGATENDILFTFVGHCPGHKVYTRKFWIIDRQAIAINNFHYPFLCISDTVLKDQQRKSDDT